MTTTEFMTTPSIETPRRKGRRIAAFAIAGVVLVSGIAGTFITTGAYFTDMKTTPLNTITAATITLGLPGATASTPLVAATVLPIAAGTEATKAVVTAVNIRNVGTAAFDWDAAISNLAVVGGPADSPTLVQVQFSRDAGTTWSTATTLQAFATAGATAPQIASTTSLAAQAVNPVQLRMWLPATAGNAYQSMSLTFTLTARAIQSGIPIAGNF